MQETQEAGLPSLSLEDSLEEGTAIRSSTLAWRTLYTEEPGGLIYGVTESLTQLKRLSMHVWDLSLTRDQTLVPYTGRQILNHWNTREVLQ